MEQKRGYFLSIIIIIFMIMMWKPTIVSAGGDSMGGRPEYTEAQINAGDLGDTITFNSIKDNPMGHEFNFVDAREDNGVNLGENNIYNSDEITAEDGKTYIIRLYAHNNNPNDINAVAKDVKVAFNIPGETGNEVKVDGFISSSNATPKEYWDSIVFKSNHPFHLEYITGSARLFNNGVGNIKNADQRNGIGISDDIINAVSGGASIGFDSVESGEVPGCYEFDNIVTALVKVVYDTPYMIQTGVRLAGTKGDNWTDNLEVSIGDEVEYQILYKNTSDEDQYDVMLRDILPEGLEYVPGSTKLWNEHSSGASIDQDDLVTEKGINIGAYGSGANGYVRFNAKVVDESLVEGANTLVNWGQGTVDNALLQSSASIIVQKIEKFKIVSIISIAALIVCIMNNIQLRRKMRQYE